MNLSRTHWLVKRRAKFKPPVVATVFWQGLKATKSKFCPIIKLT